MSFDDPDISIVHLACNANRFHPCIDSFGQLNHTEDIAKRDESVQTNHPISFNTEHFERPAKAVCAKEMET